MEHPYIDPVIFEIGPVALRWYGLMYLLGFLGAYLLGNWRAKQPGSGWTQDQVSDFLFFGFLGVILGGRIGYMLFYDFGGLMADPISLFRIWDGGMSFHGGMLGVAAAMWYFARKSGKHFFDVTDYFIPMVPIGLGFGRLGNFINGELWGRPVVDETLPWAMKFSCSAEHPWYVGCDPAGLLRHPSQLYEMIFEGIVLFIILWWFSAKPRPRMAVSGLFLVGYGVFRSVIEFYRQPDQGLEVLPLGLTMGQWLSVPMILGGLLMLILAYRSKRFASTKVTAK